jgi:hypothetical protein
LVLALTLGYSGAASATLWQIGDVISYGQGSWGSAPTTTNAAGLLVANYDSVYASTIGQVVVGIPGASGFAMVFTAATSVLAYLPASGGSIGPLTSNLLDPTSSASGQFGGDVLGLRLNIDFSDAGVLVGTSGIAFGDLILTNFATLPSLNGLTLRQFSGIVNTLLGGGSNGFTIADLDPITQEITWRSPAASL